MKDGKEYMEEKISHYMLKHLTRRRILQSEKLRNFKYQKTVVPSRSKSRPKDGRIAWDVFYNDSYIMSFDTLKEVKYFITEKANT